MTHELFAREAQTAVGVFRCIRFLRALIPISKPFGKRRRRIDVFRNRPVVEVENELLIHKHIRTARLVFKVANFLHEPKVVLEKGKIAFDLALHESLSNEELARKLRIVASEAHAPPLINGEPVERALFERHDFAPLLFPVRLRPVFANERTSSALYPVGIDVCNTSRIELRRFHDLPGENPAAALFRTDRTRPNPELDSARAEVWRRPKIAFDGFRADIAEKPRKKRSVHFLKGGRRRIEAPAEVRNETFELMLDFAPFTQAARRQVAPLHFLIELAVAFFFCARLLNKVPELDVGKKIASFVSELAMRLVCGLLRIDGTLARVLHGKA